MPDYSRTGTEITVNTQTTGNQSRPSVAGFTGGGFVTVWVTSDATQDGSGTAIKFQLYDAAGLAVGSEVLVNSATTLNQRAPSVTTLASGNFLVTWETADTSQDGAGTAIKAQLFSSAGVAIGGEFRVNTRTTGDQINSVATALADGGFVVAWQTTDSTQDGHSNAIKGQRYDASGVAVGAEFLINPTAVGFESTPNLTALAGGGFLATWTLGQGQNADVYAQLFDAAGVKTGTAFRVNTVTALNQDYTSATQLADGRIVITWASLASTTTADSDIKAQVFSATGVRIGDEFAVSTTRIHADYGHFLGPTKPQIGALPDGGFVITWTQSGLEGSISGQFYDANLERVGGEVLVSPNINRMTTDGDVAVDGLGNVFAAWSSGARSSPFDYDIRGQLFTTAPGLAIVSNGGGDIAAVTVGENSTAVTTVSANGDPGVVYAIIGGLDAGSFTIDAVTGALAFASAPNFEFAADLSGNNIYRVVVSATRGMQFDTQQLTVTVANVNEAPSFNFSQTAYTYVENDTGPVAAGGAKDPDGDTLTYSLTGADAAHFRISAEGTVTFATPPDYDAAADAGGNHVYDVTVVASDGAISITRALTVELFNRNEAPVITSNGGGASAAITVNENTVAVTTVTGTDPENTALTYAITGGTDAARFAINATTGALTFVTAPNREAPVDANGDNVYQVIVRASDGTLLDTQTLAVTVANVNEAVTITSSSALTMAENGFVVTTVTATDLDGTLPNYAITGGADAALFAIDAVTGALSFVAAPDFETPADADHDNVYQVVVSASDGSLSDARALSVTVANLSDSAPVITSFPGDTIVAAIDENQTAWLDLDATDADGDTVVFSLAGLDAASLTIDAATGLVSFVTAPDHEAPASAQGSNSYVFDVVASDGVHSSVLHVTLEVSDLDEALTITSAGGSIAITENATAVTTVAAADPEGEAPVYAIAGGADAALFALDAGTGELTFVAGPDFEAPADADGNNVYDVIVSASDGNFSQTQTLAVIVTDANEAPAIASDGGGASAALALAENATAVTTVAAADPEGDAPAYAIAGGADAAHFAIDAATGELSFVMAPDFEAPGDADGDNVYEVEVSASDGSNADTQTLLVTVADANEAPVIVSGGGAPAALTLDEGLTTVTVVIAADPDGDAPAYAIAGGADAALFAIDATTGALTFIAAPDFEAPADADADNVYEVVVSADDGSASDSQAFAVTVGNVNEAPVIVSNGGGDSAALAIDENTVAVTTVSAADPEGGVSYAIAGGADAARFAIDAVTGALSFLAAPDYEAPSDADGDNLYDVVVSATDGSLADTQALTIAVSDVPGPAVDGTAAGNTLTGGAEEDTLRGLAGNDKLSGLDGDDILEGGEGADRLTGGAGDDTMVGGAGDDTYYVDSAGDLVVEYANEGADVVRAQVDYALADNVEELFVGGAARNGTGNALANTLHGSASNNALLGLAGDDVIRGLGGRDAIDGGEGADLLDGGVGKDTLTGGSGRDAFQFRDGDFGTTRALADVITDFSQADREKIQLQLVDANTVLAGDQAFAWIGTGAFTGAAGQLRYAHQAGNTYVEGDTDGDGALDFAIMLTGAVTLTSADFTL